MAELNNGVVSNLMSALERDYRGVNIAVYALASAGLAFSIHKIRPVSKFSTASKVPSHFIRHHQPMAGVFVGLKHSPLRLLVDHKAPIYLPLWHSSKPPLPIKLWGVDVVSGNAASWLDCVAKGRKVTINPISRDKDELVSTVIVHLKLDSKSVENIDIGKKLVELGYAKVTVPKRVPKNTMESQLAPALLSAEKTAKSYRTGIWSNQLPPLPFYVIYWRKSSQISKRVIKLSFRKMLELLVFTSTGALVGAKMLTNMALQAASKNVNKIQINKRIT